MGRIDLAFVFIHISTILIISMIIYIFKRNNKTQLHKIFMWNLILIFIWCLCVILKTYFKNIENIEIFLDNLTYVGACYSSVTLLLTGLIFAHTKINFTWKYYLLFIIPTLTNILIWTNNKHHLFYKFYSLDMSKLIIGNYFLIHSIYSYVCIFIGLYYLLYFSIKNSGFFSKQALLIFGGSLVPILVNILYTFRIITTIYATPIAFSFLIICYIFATLRFSFLNIAPIALQSIVDRISDSFVVINEEMSIIDYNKPFLKISTAFNKFKRSENFIDSLKMAKISIIEIEKFLEAIRQVRSSKVFTSFEVTFSMNDTKKYFNVEITQIISKNKYIGTIILFKDITQAKLDLETIKENQAILVEQERLASLGQLIGGIAHNIKTPIMSISGGIEALKDLVFEYRDSIGDRSVTEEDHKDIAKEMITWLDKMKPYCAYMSDVISAVKGQAVQMNASSTDKFTVDELIKKVELLMKHELKLNHCMLKLDSQIDMMTEIKGEVNNLVQVFDNIIINAVHAYEGKDGIIDLKIVRNGDMIDFIFSDYAKGIPKEIYDRLFKEMVTTKGKKGTGLGLYMSYSTIKGRFSGNMSFTSKEGEGTTFYISIPYISQNKKEVIQ